jgi:hypothetical protein
MATLTRRFNKLPEPRNYDLEQGQTIDDTLALTADGTAWDASGWTSITLRVEDADGAAQTLQNPTISASGDNSNEIRILITATDSATWDGSYKYGVEAVIDSDDPVMVDGATKTIWSGTITVTNPI